MSIVTQITTTIREAADQHDFATCRGQIMILFDDVDKHRAFSVVLRQLKDYQTIFEKSYSDIVWIPNALSLLESKASPEQIKPLLRWEEFETWGQNAYFGSVEELCWSYFALWNDENIPKAKENLLRSLQSVSSAHRYHFWSRQYPHLVQFWYSRDATEEQELLTRLSFARDPLVQEFAKKKWYNIATQIESGVI